MPFSAFTLVELIVVITILAILATVGFLSLSGYTDDARSATVAANVRTVYSAILSESTTSGNSPRYYIDHDPAAALSGAVAFVDGNPVVLTGGQWGSGGTNYSAGNPRWDRLRMNGDKFRLAFAVPEGIAGLGGIAEPAWAAYDTGAVSVGAFDASGKPTLTGKSKPVTYFQVVGVSPSTKKASVTGNLPVGSTGVQWLVRNLASSGAHDVLMEGAPNYYPGCDTADITLPNGQRWAACNAGATKAWTGGTVPNCAATTTDCVAGMRDTLGGYYQWGRNGDVSAGGSTTTLAPGGTLAGTVGHNDFIIDQNLPPQDWIAVQNANLWGWSGTVLDSGTFRDRSASDKLAMRGPCAPGYHVPTRFEWWSAINALRPGTLNSRTWQIDTSIATTLKLPLAGRRLRSDGTFQSQGVNGFYWTSSPTTCLPTDSDFATCLPTNGEVAMVSSTRVIPADDYGRAQGFSVRCMAD